MITELKNGIMISDYIPTETEKEEVEKKIAEMQTKEHLENRLKFLETKTKGKK